MFFSAKLFVLATVAYSVLGHVTPERNSERGLETFTHQSGVRLHPRGSVLTTQGKATASTPEKKTASTEEECGTENTKCLTKAQSKIIGRKKARKDCESIFQECIKEIKRNKKLDTGEGPSRIGDPFRPVTGTSEETDICTICHDELGGNKATGNEATSTLKCGHSFHKGCIDKWFAEEREKDTKLFTYSCPYCKAKIHKCGICHEDLDLGGDNKAKATTDDKATATTLECLHSFHKKCINAEFERQNTNNLNLKRFKYTCPQCEEKVDYNG